MPTRSKPQAACSARDASLSVLHVLEPPRREATTTSTNPLEWEMRRTQARHHLDAISQEHGTPELPIETALRKAQAHVRSKKKWEHPFFWAGWVLWGVPE